MWDSFKAACEGLWIVLRTERNAGIIAVIGIGVLTAGFILEVSKIEFMFLLIMVTFVFLCEVFNTLAESILDMIQPETDPHVKILKDISSAAVLLASLSSLAIGIIIFSPKILALLKH